MKSSANKKITLYKNIKDGYADINAWQSYDALPINNSVELKPEIINEIVCVEISLEGAKDNRDIVDHKNDIDAFDYVFIQFQEIVTNFLSFFQKPVYLIITGDKLEKKNRVRSHKGLVLEMPIEMSQLLETEVSMHNDLSIFVALAKLNPENFDFAIKLIHKYPNCILASNRSEIFSKEFMQKIPLEFMYHKEISGINFLKMIESCCLNGDVVCRISGDGGDKEINFQIFCQKELSDLLIMQAEEA